MSVKSALRLALARRPPLHLITGPAGSGKTYEVCKAARQALDSNQVERIVVTRPLVTVEGEAMGFLPGDIAHKMDPYMTPLWEFLDRRSPKVQVVPLGFMRGMTLANAWIIADEAQNMTMSQARCLVSRIGPGANITMTGDPEQTDLEAASALPTLIENIDKGANEWAVHSSLSEEDVVRHEAIPYLLKLTQ
jgi:phosphate starvation-inducible PhoH-like protein